MYEKPLPVMDTDTRPFWEAAAEHRLLIQHCTNCDNFVFYPRALCPHCHSEGLEWREASGGGTIYSFTVSRLPAGPGFKDDVPYVVAIVELEEGPRMMSNVTVDDVGKVRIGERVRVCFEDVTDEITLPKFELVDL
jgi:uncharacterized OB-fold protein